MTLETLERRLHPRRQVKKHKSFILIPEETKLGEIIDMSLGGMSFHYIANEQWANGPVQHGTLFGEDDLWLDNIPLTTMHDTKISHLFSLGYPEMRRRGVSFGKLSRIQTEFIKEFMYINAMSLEEAYE